MKLKSHLLIAKNIYGMLNNYTEIELDLNYFLLGCVMPDISPRSRFEKHCLKSAELKIKKVVRKFSRYGIKKLSFELGKVTHYIADTFCLPHNNFFADIKKHYKYEALAIKIQSDYKFNKIKGYNFINNNLSYTDINFMKEQNEIYLSDIPENIHDSIFRDFDYSIEIGALLVINLVNEHASLNNICEGTIYF
jgi:hypothetical protein